MNSIKKLIAIPLFTAMTVVGGYIAIPLPGTPIPLILQNFFVFLTGLVLGARGGAAAIGLFLLMGALGFPVFSGGTGGAARFLGPSGGYLFSYIAAAWTAGFLSGGRGRRTRGRTEEAAGEASSSQTLRRTSSLRFFVSRDFFAVISALLVVYAMGVPWLKTVMGWDWPAALAGGLLPYIPGDIIKALGAAAIAPVFRRLLEAEGIGERA